MANEITVTVSLRIAKGSLSFQSLPQGFSATMNGSLGPSPGAFTAAVLGTDVDLSALDVPGMAYLQNLEDPDTSTIYAIVGIWDGVVFLPLLEFKPGEGFPMRLYRELGAEFSGTGTPSTSNTLRVMGVGGPCKFLVQAFEA